MIANFSSNRKNRVQKTDLNNQSYILILESNKVEWLDIISIKPTQNDIGKEIYYSLNAVQRNTITYDTYLEGCVIKKGVITRVSENILQIDGKYNYLKYNAVLFDKPEYCILYLHYDGAEIFEDNELLPMFGEDLFSIEI